MYGAKINAIRNARGYTQEYLAHKIGISQVTLCKIERDDCNKIDKETLTKIAEGLGVSLDDIMSPTPIVMNFHNSPQSGQFANYTDDKIIQTLLQHLEKKDKHLEKIVEQMAEILNRMTERK